MSNLGKFDPKSIQKGIYDYWKSKDFFEDINSNKPIFSIMMPPPNVTGHLHLGHAWDGSLQDTVVRYKKLKGFNAIWIPGTDHAGIATQTKYEKILASKGIKKESLSNDEFVNQIYTWASSQAKYIKEQWAKLGFCLSYKNEVFTLDPAVKDLVVNSFKNLYDHKLIYQAYKQVNWDVKLQTAISDIEINYKPTKSKLYYFKYILANNPHKFIPIATTRPETMFVDTNVIVNPKDKRYKTFIGEYVINPINNQKLKVITDSYIDMKFGTGAMKCTPAHDANDYELALKHNITDYKSVINNDGTLNEYAQSVTKSFKGIDRLVARDDIVNEMASRGMLIKTESYDNEVGYSERTGEVVEHLLSKQWFIKMKPIVDHLSKVQRSSKTKYSFIPTRFKKTLNTWLKNINDWCISRQLSWGHKIPVWYHKKTNEVFVGAIPPNKKDYVQDKSVLDTWFSSGLWPIATTIKNKKGMEKFFPISVLITAYDILFFWVARMLFQCSYANNQIPIKKILIHGLIRDSQNRKMSKSLGNGIDPMDVIDQYGTDALRMFLTSTASIGEDLRYDEEKIKSYNNFFNKVWNIKNFIVLHTKSNSSFDKFNFINAWIIDTFNKYLSKINKNMDSYNFVVANKYLVEFIWDIFCNQYIEFIKPSLKDETLKDETIYVMNLIFKNILILLHPHAPFLTERIYQELYKDHESILLESWPKPIKTSIKKNEIIIFISIFNAIKDIRIKYSISKSNAININVLTTKKVDRGLLNFFLNKFNVNIVNISTTRKKLDWNLTTVGDIAIEFDNKFVDKASIISKLEKQLHLLEAELKRSQSILSNKNFISKAPKQKIDLEKQKYESYLTQFKQVSEEIKKYK